MDTELLEIPFAVTLQTVSRSRLKLPQMLQHLTNAVILEWQSISFVFRV